jgi:hypothetical protein
MSQSLFTLYVAAMCPVEYAAMKLARERHTDLFTRYMDGDPAVSEQDATEAKRASDAAEENARRAWREKMDKEGLPPVRPQEQNDEH